MSYKLVHIVPFDIGNSFVDFEFNKKSNKSTFLNNVRSAIEVHKFTEIECYDDKVMLIAELSPYVKCYLISYGVGVFVIENLNLVTEQINFENLACQLYYNKKVEQREILSFQNDNLACMKLFMGIVWSSLPKKERPLTASSAYKYQGLSYVLSIYYIDCNENNDLDKEIDLLMNPEIMSNILDKADWPLIQNEVANYEKVGYDCINFSANSKVVSSWSGVLVLDDCECNSLQKIIDYEIILQAAWFLYDSLIDSLKKSQQNNIQLQRIRSLVSYVSMEISNITSANMSTNEIKVFEQIYTSSGIGIVEGKLNRLLENRINIEEAKHKIKQTNYGIITEILLVLFTIINLYGPVKALFENNMDSKDIFIMVIMVFALILCSILIIRKEK